MIILFSSKANQRKCKWQWNAIEESNSMLFVGNEFVRKTIKMWHKNRISVRYKFYAGHEFNLLLKEKPRKKKTGTKVNQTYKRNNFDC